jgi:hypothetical protein
MTKIEQGIQINNQHIYNVENNINEPISFIDQIKNIGYSSLKEFFEEKAEYEMQNVLRNKIYSVSPKDAMNTLQNLIKNNEYGIVSVYTDETCVHHGQDLSKYLNESYCQLHNIPIYSYNSFGGNIVATKGDYSFAIIVPSSIDINANFILKRIVSILRKYYTNKNDIAIENNDILIDGKKVLGSTVFGNDKMIFCICHFSMTEKQTLISKICGEPSTGKYAGYIKEELLTTEQLMEEVLKWLQGL